jgi:hypothetical protein
VFGTAYRRGRYDRRIDYSQAVPPPALSAGDQLWASDLATGRAAG